MQRHGLTGNVLNDFNWGGYLIWHLTPASKVFIDGRYDTVYSITEINDYLLFYFDRPGGSRVLSAYPHDFVLIPPRSAAFHLNDERHGMDAGNINDENSRFRASRFAGRKHSRRSRERGETRESILSVMRATMSAMPKTWCGELN